ncbi:hypothetical protein C8A03DRAFT_37684 [Achaetomium macrosporum]|uniref:Uncharacterized protein n=1 Tax=Achaetomium macrosporum TaxID=79813 RepID=A0AAN7H4I5_9PEZI|nr:hypothetical protein C8A03DRAFT_37684 [Achaetomium macrosporum]
MNAPCNPGQLPPPRSYPAARYNTTPTWNGSFVALDYTTCALPWTLNATQLIRHYGALLRDQARATYQPSRNSPQIDGDMLFFGTQAHALVLAVNRHSGAVLDMLRINSHPFAVITISPTIYLPGHPLRQNLQLRGGRPLFFPDYQCYTFTGNAAALTFSLRRCKLILRWSIGEVK